MKRLALLLLAVVATPALAFGPPAPEKTVEHATEVLVDLEKIPSKGIPPALLKDAQAVVIIPRVIKAGFVFGGRGGHGLALVRNEKGEWNDPAFLNIGGASVGFQVGVQATDLVLVFKKKDSLDKILDGKNKLTLGGDIAVAAGPLGRQASAATDGKLQAEIWSYSRSRGLFAGVSLDGAVLMADTTSTKTYEQDKSEAKAKALAGLKNKVNDLSKDDATPSK